MHRTTRIKITELNPHLICVLCGGYYIDASTIIECLHSFCRTCIVRYLESSKYCPICDVMVHKTKPLQNVKSDKTLQDLVYKLVPGLYKNEMKRRRELYREHPEAPEAKLPGPSEDLGDEDRDRLIYTFDEKISLSLELYSEMVPDEELDSDTGQGNPDKLRRHDVRYLQCPAAVTMAHLKKFIRMKFDLPHKFQIDIYHSDEPLDDVFTLMDVAYIYTWRRNSPLRLIYTIYEKSGPKRKSEEEADGTSKEKQARLSSPEGESRMEKPSTVTELPSVKESSTSSSADNKLLASSSDNAKSPTKENEQTKCIVKDLSNKSPKCDDKQNVNGDHTFSAESSLSVMSNDSVSSDKPSSLTAGKSVNITCGKEKFVSTTGKDKSCNGPSGKEKPASVISNGKDKINSANSSTKDKSSSLTNVKDKVTYGCTVAKDKTNGISNGKESVYDFTDGRDSPNNCEKLMGTKTSLKHFSGPKKTYSKSPNGKLTLNKDFPAKYTDGEVISQKLGKKLLKNKGSKDFDKSVYDCTGKVKSSKFNVIYTKHILNGN